MTITREEALKKIEENVEEAKRLIGEAYLIAKEHRVSFTVGIIKENVDGFAEGVAGWEPSGLDC